jgi:predicted transglutaminase-like protease
MLIFVTIFVKLTLVIYIIIIIIIIIICYHLYTQNICNYIRFPSHDERCELWHKHFPQYVRRAQ